MFLFGLMLLLPKYVMLLQCSASCDFCTKFSPVPIHFLLRLLLITSQIRMFPVLLMTCSPVLCSSGDAGSKQQSKHCHYWWQKANTIWRPPSKESWTWLWKLSWRCPGTPSYPIRKTLLGSRCVWKRCLGSGVKWWKLPLQSNISFKCWKKPFISQGD